MFSQAFVCPQGGLCPEGVSVGISVQGVSVQGGLCKDGVPVKGDREPLSVLTATEATHPTGMHSC